VRISIPPRQAMSGHKMPFYAQQPTASPSACWWCALYMWWGQLMLIFGKSQALCMGIGARHTETPGSLSDAVVATCSGASACHADGRSLFPDRRSLSWRAPLREVRVEGRECAACGACAVALPSAPVVNCFPTICDRTHERVWQLVGASSHADSGGGGGGGGGGEPGGGKAKEEGLT